MNDETTTPSPVIGGLTQLTDAQRLELLRDVLDFFTTDPERPQAQRVSDMLTDDRFHGYSRDLLKRVTVSLTTTGLLFKLPQRGTRDSSYVTTREGRANREGYAAQLEELGGE